MGCLRGVGHAGMNCRSSAQAILTASSNDPALMIGIVSIMSMTMSGLFEVTANETRKALPSNSTPRVMI